jgi:hypothetical protein
LIWYFFLGSISTKYRSFKINLSSLQQLKQNNF